MQREHAQIMKITNGFFNPISAFAQTNLIIELKLTVYLFSKKLETDPLTSRGRGGLWFFSKQIFWFRMLLKIIFWFWWREKKSVSEFLSYNLMLNSWKKNSHFATKKINIITLMLSGKKILNEAKNHNPPCKLNGRSLNVLISEKFSQYDDTFSSSLCHSLYNKFINNSGHCLWEKLSQ